MMKKLDCIIVDDDEFIIQTMRDLFDASFPFQVKESFSSPKKFLEVANDISYDLCLLDILMPEIDGILIAKLLKNKPIIFVTGAYDNLKDAVALEPIDIVLKPIEKNKLSNSLDKAYTLITQKRVEENGKGREKEFELFNTAQSSRKVKIRLSDICFVASDEIDPRNKQVILKDGEKVTLMDCTLERLKEIVPKLIQINRSQLVSFDAVKEVERDIVVINCLNEDKRHIYLNLGRSYRSEFVKRFQEI